MKDITSRIEQRDGDLSTELPEWLGDMIRLDDRVVLTICPRGVPTSWDDPSIVELSMSIEHAETIAYVLSRYVEGARRDAVVPAAPRQANCRTRRK